MQAAKTYVGIHKELNGGMTDTAKIIRDAWVFGLIPESESCEGWTLQRLETLWDKVDVEWKKYGFLVSQLPADLRHRFMEIHGTALEQARAAGWDGSFEL